MEHLLWVIMRLNSGSTLVWVPGQRTKWGREREGERKKLPCKSFKNRTSPIINTFSTCLLLPRAPLLWGFRVSPPQWNPQHWDGPSRIIPVSGSFIKCRFPSSSPAELIQNFWWVLRGDSYSISTPSTTFRESCSSCCCCSVAKSCLTICDPMNCSTPGFPVLYHLPEFAQVHVLWNSSQSLIFREEKNPE